jgi:hypothetical protein
MHPRDLRISPQIRTETRWKVKRAEEKLFAQALALQMSLATNPLKVIRDLVLQPSLGNLLSHYPRDTSRPKQLHQRPLKGEMTGSN